MRPVGQQVAVREERDPALRAADLEAVHLNPRRLQRRRKDVGQRIGNVFADVLLSRS